MPFLSIGCVFWALVALFSHFDTPFGHFGHILLSFAHSAPTPRGQLVTIFYEWPKNGVALLSCHRKYRKRVPKSDCSNGCQSTPRRNPYASLLHPLFKPWNLNCWPRNIFSIRVQNCCFEGQKPDFGRRKTDLEGCNPDFEGWNLDFEGWNPDFEGWNLDFED